MERAFVLIETGAITIAAVRESQKMKKAIKMPSVVNPGTGKETTRYMAFSEVSWKMPVAYYLKTINSKIDDAGMKVIIDKATAFAKVVGDDGGDSSDLDEDEDERAQLTEGSGSSDIEIEDD